LPRELSGGMRKRAALARALALEPTFLFFDEPTAGLDPITARQIDRLIVQVRQTVGATIIVVSHSLSSIFQVADRMILLDPEVKGIIAAGAPAELAAPGGDPRVTEFLGRPPQRDKAMACP
jgi:phospholipid/cholesterol/gamma-HCH transport system ATP-binding protein